ncbi:isoleucine--tRNA ligase [Butyricicoccus pullicaecorum]|uniref:Isoleucine--tRNA ligase n=1 Tax=Butyricicoccus pullicaecorum 1.2 TaxID=1203606 RepID=R8W4Q0_9FIRM|nr:isoleucine--tRNA ligase [Butyricicoccus pullicaecorum]EOQ39694.1 isoleucine-tRNA ligase [Butyricicoccus pullicaecorum 1.2]SKA57028.1 Isoleucyl-tRNA synthetase [Butyricicoccus pullicaecorum DSM 23266]
MPQDYNETINLPKTDFPMRANLPKREPGFLAGWEQDNNALYHALMKKNEGKPLFVLHDGPPYANGNLHMGHALNKVLKDFIVRYKNMAGFYAPYVPGWDTHGLPIERQAIQAYGMDRDKVSVSEFRQKCEEFARKHVNTQREQFKRLGVIGDWEHPYLTLTHDFEAKQIEIFGEMAKKGYIYKGLKPVYWCPHDETALAEAEIEYQDEPCSSIYVKFAVTDDKGVIEKAIGTKENVYFVIWTTTTWTLPGNLAISVNPFFEYDLVKVPNGEIYVLAKELVNSVMQAAGIESWEVLATLLGSDLEMMKTQHPIMDRESVIITGEHVTLDAGTGCVHTAPGFGADDFIVCQKYNIPIIVPVDGKGYATEDAGKYAGMYYEKTTPIILDDLRACNALLAIEDIVHSYPHCWRCKNPIIFRATEQWFCSVDALKDDAVKACHEITWLPGWGEERMTSMIMERSDWCISRQRIWGVPIPIFFCKKCGKPLVNEQTIKLVSDLFREKGSNAWFEMDTSEILPSDIHCECGCGEFDKETDTMDVWFDSGSSWAAVIEQREGQPIPVDVYLEGNDQYRGWFQSSMLTAIATKGIAPYKTVITHGMIVDEERQKMSKSLGNGISPQEILDQYGADILRLWVSSADYRQDMRISKEMFKHLAQNYLKIRNTARYILGNLEGFDPKTDMVAYNDLCELDRWALMKLNDLVAKVIKGYDDYEFHVVLHAIHNFCVVDMSNFYLDVIKDRLYCEEKNGVLRRSAQTAMYEILDALVRMIAPILCFTADEIWQAMPHRDGDDAANIVLNAMPKVNPAWAFAEEASSKWDKLIALRDDVNKALEEARKNKVIGKPLEAWVTVYADDETAALLETVPADELAALCIVSKLRVIRGNGEGMQGENLPVQIAIERASGDKCERCWMYVDSIGQDSKHPTLCARCAAVVGE